MDLRHGRAAIGLALAVEPLLMGAEIGDPRPDLGLEVLPQVKTRKEEPASISPAAFLLLIRLLVTSFGAWAAGGVSASRDLMSGRGVAARMVSDVSTESRATDAVTVFSATVFSASGVLPVTD